MSLVEERPKAQPQEAEGDEPQPWELVNYNDLDEDTVAFLNAKRESLKATVPEVGPPPHMHIWAVKVWGEWVGAFTFTQYTHLGEVYGETGLRIWQPSRAVMEAGRHWLAWLLGFNSYLLGRVYPSNRPVLRLLQQLGYQLVSYDYSVDGQVLEVHRLERGRLMGERPRLPPTQFPEPES